MRHLCDNLKARLGTTSDALIFMEFMQRRIDAQISYETIYTFQTRKWLGIRIGWLCTHQHEQEYFA